MDRHNELYEHTEHSEESYQRQQEEQAWADIKLTEECMKEEAKVQSDMGILEKWVEMEKSQPNIFKEANERIEKQAQETMEKLRKGEKIIWDTSVQPFHDYIEGEGGYNASMYLQDTVTTTGPEGIQEQHQVGYCQQVLDSQWYTNLEGIKMQLETLHIRVKAGHMRKGVMYPREEQGYQVDSMYVSSVEEELQEMITGLKNTIDKGYYIQTDPMK